MAITESTRHDVLEIHCNDGDEKIVKFIQEVSNIYKIEAVNIIEGGSKKIFHVRFEKEDDCFMVKKAASLPQEILPLVETASQLAII